jgi:hypothetical protein
MSSCLRSVSFIARVRVKRPRAAVFLLFQFITIPRLTYNFLQPRFTSEKLREGIEAGHLPIDRTVRLAEKHVAEDEYLPHLLERLAQDLSAGQYVSLEPCFVVGYWVGVVEPAPL